MKKKIVLIAFLLALTVTVPGPSYAPAPVKAPSGAVVPDVSVARPAIAITYRGTFAGQTAAGLLDLVVELTIENGGYQSFLTSSESFSVVVDNYAYRPLESDLPAVALPDGERVSGRLGFQVPPAAATTRVGYEMAHAGQAGHNIRWLKQAAPTIATPAPDAAVSITYSDSYMWVKDSSSLYLLVDMIIENRGYGSFNTSPEYFTLVIGNILGLSSPIPPISFDGRLSDAKDGAYSNLRAYDLQDGGKLSGTLAFEVPPEILSSTEKYRLDYSGVRSYNIQWSWQPSTK